jgi:hypothetical protein
VCVLADTFGPVNLDRTINHAKSHGRYRELPISLSRPGSIRMTDLGDTDILHGGLCTVQVDLPRGGEDQQPSLVDLGAGVGDIGENRSYQSQLTCRSEIGEGSGS